MAEQVTIEIPIELSPLLKRVVAASGETSKTILQDWLIHSVPELKTIDIDQYVQEFESYTDIRLWTLVERSLDRLQEVDQDMKNLGDKQKQGIQLTTIEKDKLDSLSNNYNDLILLRAKALLALKQGGHDVHHYIESVAPKP